MQGQLFGKLEYLRATARFQIVLRHAKYKILEIKPCGLVSRIQNVEAFWYKTEIKIIYFVPLWLIVLIVSDCMVKCQKLNMKNWSQGKP